MNETYRNRGYCSKSTHCTFPSEAKRKGMGGGKYRGKGTGKGTRQRQKQGQDTGQSDSCETRSQFWKGQRPAYWTSCRGSHHTSECTKRHKQPVALKHGQGHWTRVCSVRTTRRLTHQFTAMLPFLLLSVSVLLHFEER